MPKFTSVGASASRGLRGYLIEQEVRYNTERSERLMARADDQGQSHTPRGAGADFSN